MAVAAVSLAACGSTASPPRVRTATTGRAATAPAQTATAAAATRSGLTRFLLAAGQESFFPPAPGGGTFATLKGWVEFTQLTAADERLLRSEGFVAAAQENVGGDGANFVEEFTSARGARREASADAQQSTQGGGQAAFFTVAGLPNSHGVLVGQAGGVGTNLYWTEGRCTMWLGSGAATALKAQVVAGAKAIDRRTGRTCP